MEEVILGMCLRTIGFGEIEWKESQYFRIREHQEQRHWRGCCVSKENSTNGGMDQNNKLRLFCGVHHIFIENLYIFLKIEPFTCEDVTIKGAVEDVFCKLACQGQLEPKPRSRTRYSQV